MELVKMSYRPRTIREIDVCNSCCVTVLSLGKLLSRPRSLLKGGRKVIRWGGLWREAEIDGRVAWAVATAVGRRPDHVWAAYSHGRWSGLRARLLLPVHLHPRHRFAVPVHLLGQSLCLSLYLSSPYLPFLRSELTVRSVFSEVLTWPTLCRMIFS